MPANWYFIDSGISVGSMKTGRMVLSSSLARASSRTTFLDWAELVEMARMRILQLLMALTISWLHMAAPSMPASSIHTVMPA